jgi:hypothetical protein
MRRPDPRKALHGMAVWLTGIGGPGYLVKGRIRYDDTCVPSLVARQDMAFAARWRASGPLTPPRGL